MSTYVLVTFIHLEPSSFRRPFCLVNQEHTDYSACLDICVQFICSISQRHFAGLTLSCCRLCARLNKLTKLKSNFFIILRIAFHCYGAQIRRYFSLLLYVLGMSAKTVLCHLYITCNVCQPCQLKLYCVSIAKNI